MSMPAKKKAKAIDVKGEQKLNDSLLEDSLALAATQHGINEDYDMEARERKIEESPAAKKKAKK